VLVSFIVLTNLTNTKADSLFKGLCGRKLMVVKSRNCLSNLSCYLCCLHKNEAPAAAKCGILCKGHTQLSGNILFKSLSTME